MESAVAGQKAMAPLIDAQIKRLSQPLPTPPAPVQQPQVPQREEVMSGLEQTLMGLATFGAIIGGRGRTHTTNALAAMTGAIEGLSEGNEKKFDQNVKVFDMESKRAQAIYQEQRNQFLDTIQNRTLGAEEMKMQLALMSQRYNDPAMQQSLANLKDTATLFEGRDKIAAEFEEYRLGLRGTLYRMGAAGMDPNELDVLAAMYNLTGAAGHWKDGLPAYGGQRQAVIQRATASSSGANPIPLEAQQQAEDLVRRGLSYTGQTAGARSTGVRVANLERLQYSVVAVANEAVAKSNALPRGQFVPYNRAVQMVQAGTSNEALRQFVIAHESLVDTWAQMLKPSGVVDQGLRERLVHDIDLADSPQAYKAGVDEIKKLIGLERQALEKLQRGEPIGDIDASIGESFAGTRATVHPDPGRYGVRSIEVVP
jgi:hypothetical protein